MKKIMVGGILLLNGVILYIGIYIPTALYASKLNSWRTPPGRFGTALDEMGGTTAFHMSIIMMVCGIVFLVWGCFEEEFKQFLKKITSR